MPAFMRLTIKAGSGLSQGNSWSSFWLYSSTGDEDDGPDLCDALEGRLSTHLLPVLSGYWNCSRIDWQYWPQQTLQPYPTQVHGIDPIVGGIAVGDPLPPRMTMLIEYKALAHKPNRKRVYIGRYNEGQNSGTGTPDGTTVAAVQAFADNTRNSLSVNGHDWQFAIVQQRRQVTEEGVVYYTPWAYNDIDSHLVQSKWAYLRSRDAGVGI